MHNRFKFRQVCAVIVGLCIAGLIGSVFSVRGDGSGPCYFAVVNARIVTGTASVIDSGTVVIAKGLIQAVGASVTIPPEAWVIDGKGLTVYPGLIDAGTDLGLPKEAEFGDYIDRAWKKTSCAVRGNCKRSRRPARNDSVAGGCRRIKNGRQDESRLGVTQVSPPR